MRWICSFFFVPLAGCLLFITGCVSTGGGSGAAVAKVTKEAYRGAYVLDGQGASQRLNYLDKIETHQVVGVGANGETTIRMMDRTKIQLGPGSRMRVLDYALDPETDTGRLVLAFDQGPWRLIAKEGAMVNRDRTLVVLPAGVLLFTGEDAYGDSGSGEKTVFKFVDGEGVFVPKQAILDYAAEQGVGPDFDPLSLYETKEGK